MDEEKSEKKSNVGALEKRRVVMADGKRYLIYYTFEKSEKSDAPEKSAAREVKDDE